MSSNTFFQSPTVVLPPTGDQYFVSSHYVDQSAHMPAINGVSPNGLANTNTRPFAPGPAVTPGSIAGRKRSRADIFSPDDENDHLEDGSVQAPAADHMSQDQSVYGLGMVVESQSGTSVDGDAEHAPFSTSHAKRPSVTSRKSARIYSDASGPDDLAQLVLPPQMRDVTSEPLIDEATRLLGISWTRMDSTEALQISQKAYAKWIQNHYPSLSDVAVWFENSAIPGYLVVAQNVYSSQQEYYIFSNDLTEARLVTNESSQLVPRLKMLPALHLAAPGGHIRAETDTITAAQNEINELPAAAPRDTTPDYPLVGACAAHAMELD